MGHRLGQGVGHATRHGLGQVLYTPKWPTLFFDAPFLVLLSPRQKSSWRRQNTLGQKQYLVGEVRESFLIHVYWIINKNRMSEWSSFDYPLSNIHEQK